MRSVSTAPVGFIFNPVRCSATGVRKVRGGVLPLRVLTILGGVPDHQGHETAQPVLGVGSRLGEYPYPAYLRGVAAGLTPPVLSVPIVHIRLFVEPCRRRRCTLRSPHRLFGSSRCAVSASLSVLLPSRVGASVLQRLEPSCARPQTPRLLSPDLVRRPVNGRVRDSHGGQQMPQSQFNCQVVQDQEIAVAGPAQSPSPSVQRGSDRSEPPCDLVPTHPRHLLEVLQHLGKAVIRESVSADAPVRCPPARHGALHRDLGITQRSRCPPARHGAARPTGWRPRIRRP